MVEKSNYDRQIEARTIARGLPIDTNRTYSPEEAQAMLAKLVANPIPARNGSWQGGYDGPGFRAYSWKLLGQQPGYRVEDPRIDEQTAKPEKPETRYVSASTYGKTIPISMGKRRLEGNLILCTALVPKLVGNRDFTIEYEVPIYEDPPVDPEIGFNLDTSGGEVPEDPDEDPPASEVCGKPDECDTRILFTIGEEEPDEEEPEPGEKPYFFNAWAGSNDCSFRLFQLNRDGPALNGSTLVETAAEAQALYNNWVTTYGGGGWTNVGACWGKFNLSASTGSFVDQFNDCMEIH